MQKFIHVKGAKENNLKDIEVFIPKNKLVVITGVSGSGKSSLAFDTLYAEGKRKYVESLSSYARQFAGRMQKPQVDFIKGLSPAIAIEQKTHSSNIRSTVGTVTEIYDYLKMLYARIGKVYSPITNKEIKCQTSNDIIEDILKFAPNTSIYFLIPIANDENISSHLKTLLEKGYNRILVDNVIQKIEDYIVNTIAPTTTLELVIGRYFIEGNLEPQDISECREMAESAFSEGKGKSSLKYQTADGVWKTNSYSRILEEDGIVYTMPTPHFFAFNNSFGACKNCEGTGMAYDISPALIIPNPELTIYNGAIHPWRTTGMNAWLQSFIKSATKTDFPLHTPYNNLSKEEKELVWNGNKTIRGIHHFFTDIKSQSHKIQYAVLLAKYKERTTCVECTGSRLRKDASYVKINAKSIIDVVLLPIDESVAFFKNIVLTEQEQNIADRLLEEIIARLEILCEVGLPYLTLNRSSNTLSGGETQRINLATSLRSSLVGALYVLDEPSIGLHPADTARLIQVLKNLRNVGNSVIIVEHDEHIIKEADFLIDMGPLAGYKGGEVVYADTPDKLWKQKKSLSLTAQYIKNNFAVPIATKRPIESTDASIQIHGCKANNLKDISITIPLNRFIAITGVSGSGKSSLMSNILYPVLRNYFENNYQAVNNKYDTIELINVEKYTTYKVEYIDQHSITRNTRSNSATYTGIYDYIREVFSIQDVAVHNKYTASHFSFNTNGGRCDTCEGDGFIVVPMQFMADLHITCEECHGKRFKEGLLEVLYKKCSIYDILTMTIDEAIDVFKDTTTPAVKGKRKNWEEMIIANLEILSKVGLGYVQVGQSTATLSGGEAQRLKLATYLIKGNSIGKHIFIFDEPTTGLHIHDVVKLNTALQELVNLGHTVIVIEHNVGVIQQADWIIDLGPKGGNEGGNVVFQGTLEGIKKCKESITAIYL